MPILFAVLLVAALGLAVLGWRLAALKAALLAARQSEARLRLLADHGGQIGWMVDAASPWRAASERLLYLSPAAGVLLGHGDGLPAGVRDDLLALLAGDLAQRIAGLAEGEATVQQTRECDLPHQDGSLVPVQLLSTLLRDAAGQPTLLVGSLRDIRARREQELAQKKFASMISHEFRSPLATIDGAIQRLEMTAGQAGADEATRKRYRKIQVAVDRLLGMINDYLSPERMASIGRKRQPNEAAPQELLDSAVAAARLTGRAVSVQVSSLPALIRCDPEGMRLSLQVLLENADKYTPAGTPVELSAAMAAGGGLEWLIADHGPGVREDEIVRLFDKGFRGRDASGIPGSGLGLYMARAVLEVHGGTLSVQNRPSGGAVFRIWLPIAADSGKTLASNDCNSDNSSTQAAVGIAAQQG